MGGDHELVRRKRPERVFDRLDRIGVADLSARPNAVGGQRRQRGDQPVRRLLARTVDVREPVSDPSDERWTDDHHLGLLATRPLHDHTAELLALDRLVRHNEYSSHLGLYYVG